MIVAFTALLLATTVSGYLPCTSSVNNTASELGKGCVFEWQSGFMQDSQCRTAETLLQTISGKGTLYGYEAAQQACAVEVLAGCSQISFTDAIPACNATGEAEVAAAQASVTEGALPPSGQQLSYRARSEGCCQDVSSGGRALFFIQTSGIGTDAICTAQGAFFDAALGPAKSIKAFFADLSKLCISVGLGTCPQYNAELTAYGAAGMPECVTSDLQPSYAAYLLGGFNAIAQLYGREAPAPAPATQAPAFGPATY